MKQQNKKHPEIQYERDFFQAINHAIKEGRHVDYLKKVLVDYQKYKQVFKNAFTDKNSINAIYIFRATYIKKRPVWRDIAISGNQTFCDLAESIIKSMSWNNDHMHSFSMKKVNNKPQQLYTEFAMYAPGWEDDPYPVFKTDEIKIADIDFAKHPKWGFVFDFGDGHEFDTELKKIDNKTKIKEFNGPLPLYIDERGIAPIQYPNFG